MAAAPPTQAHAVAVLKAIQNRILGAFTAQASTDPAPPPPAGSYYSGGKVYAPNPAPTGPGARNAPVTYSEWTPPPPLSVFHSAPPVPSLEKTPKSQLGPPTSFRQAAVRSASVKAGRHAIESGLANAAIASAYPEIAPRENQAIAIMQALAHGFIPENPDTLGGLANDALFFVPGPIRGAKALFRGFKTLRELKDIENASQAAKVVSAAGAARAAYHEPGPIRNLIAPQPQVRSFTHNGLTVTLPAARSKTGRVVEQAIDAIRDPVLSKVGIKTEAEKTGQTLGYDVRHAMTSKEAAILGLRAASKKLTTDEEYALRIVAEGVPPEMRQAHHVEGINSATSNVEALYHMEHSAQVERSAKYVTVDPETGRAVLAPDAPKRLVKAWEKFQQVGALREDLLKNMGLVEDAQLIARLMAPGRILDGARYREFEEVITESLLGSRSRDDIFKAIDQLIPDEGNAAAVKELLDALARSEAQRHGAPLEPNQLYDAVAGVHVDALPEGDVLTQPYPRPGNYGDYLETFRRSSLEQLQERAAAISGTTHYYARNGRPQSNYAQALHRVMREKEAAPAADVASETPHEGSVVFRQAAGHDLNGLPRLVNFEGKQLEVHSNADIQKLARTYMEQVGVDAIEPADYAHAVPARGERIAKAYDEMPHDPQNPEVAAAYDAMARETLAQYHHLEQAGYTFEFYPEGQDPYPNGPRGAMLDVAQNKHLYVFPTELGFGDGGVLDHPLLADSGVRWGGKPVTHNDVFRAVHDVFGHDKEGVGFRADGEENAWRQHSAMYSWQARRAMTTETRGQNSWVNFGPHGATNRTAQQAETVYADQKAGLLPNWVVTDGSGQNPGLLYQRHDLTAGPSGPKLHGDLTITRHGDKWDVYDTGPMGGYLGRFSTYNEAHSAGITYGSRAEDTFTSPSEDAGPGVLFTHGLEGVVNALPDRVGTQELLGRIKSAGVKDEEIQYTELDKFLKDAGKSVSKDEVRAWLDDHYLQVEENFRFLPGGSTSAGGQDENSDLTRWNTTFTLPHEEGYREITIRLPQARYGAIKGSNHGFPDTNMLLWIRFTDRMIDGKKTLFMEELQSDWHQLGARVGYRNEDYKTSPAYLRHVERYQEAHDDLAGLKESLRQHPVVQAAMHYLGINEMGGEIRMTLTHYLSDTQAVLNHDPQAVWGVEQDPNGRSRAMPVGPMSHDGYLGSYVGHSFVDRVKAEEYAAMMQGFLDLSPEARAALGEDVGAFREMERRVADREHDLDRFEVNESGPGIPQGPFKKTWHELGIKRLLAFAADYGYDQVGWTTGLTQMRRSNFAETFDHLEVIPITREYTIPEEYAVGSEFYNYAEQRAWDNQDPQDWTDFPEEPDRADFANEDDYSEAIDSYQRATEESLMAAEEAFSTWFSGEWDPEDYLSSQQEHYNYESAKDNTEEETSPRNADKFRLRAWTHENPKASGVEPDINYTIAAGDLPDYVGQSVADRVHELDQRHFPHSEEEAIIMGEDRAKAAGTAHFYDNKLRGFVDKYLKKFGVKSRQSEIDPQASERWQVFNTMHNNEVGFYVSEREANMAVAQYEHLYPENVGHLRVRHERVPLEPDLTAGTKVHVVNLTPEARDWINEGQKLFQRGSVYRDPFTGETLGSHGEPGQFGIKGAYELRPPQLGPNGTITPEHASVLHLLSGASDETTFIHEMAHHVWDFGLTPKERIRFARAYNKNANVEPLRVFGIKHRTLSGRTKTRNVDVARTTAAQEAWANAVESYVRRGIGPAPVKKAFLKLRPAFENITEHVDLPDVSPRMAQFLDRVFGSKKLTGGSIIGSEDVRFGVEYAPYIRGMPMNLLSRPGVTTAAYIRRASGALFGSAKRSAIGKGPEDLALRKAFTGSLLLSGFFTKDVVKPKVESGVLAVRMSAAGLAREALLDASTTIPRDVSDIAIKENPGKDAGPAIKAFWDKLDSISSSGNKLSSKDLDKITMELIEEAKQGIFPFTSEASQRAEMARTAALIMETQQPQDNIRWLSRDFMDETGLLHVPSAVRLAQRGLSKRQTQAIQRLGVGFDMANDIVKATILYLNPAYIPVQFVGNIGMALMQQGPFMGKNLLRSALLHRELMPEYRLAIDHEMQHGIFTSTPMYTNPGKLVQQTFGRWANQMADWLPRRSAWLHEAGRQDYKTSADIQGLFERVWKGDRQAEEDLKMISSRANDAMVDFERMSPLEKETLNRYIFFYPWLRGATRWSVRFIANHPVQAIALAMAVDYMVASRHEIEPGQPYSEQLDVPISTRSLGFGIPGVGGVGLDQLVGEHTWMRGGHPMNESLRQLLTFTTPEELLQTGIAFATGENQQAAQNLAQNITPLPYAAAVALFGYDPFARKEVPVGLGTFFNQLSPTVNSPLLAKLRQYNMSPAERKAAQAKQIHPRDKTETLWNVALGSVAPFPVNVELGQQRSLETKPVIVQRTTKLIADSKKYGLGQPPPAVLEDLKWKTKYDQATKESDSYLKRATVAARIYDERNHADVSAQLAQLKTNGDASAFLSEVLHQLYPTYSHWNSELEHYKRGTVAAQPAGP